VTNALRARGLLQLGDRPAGEQADRVVDEDVQLPERGHRVVDQPPCGVEVGHVRVGGDCLAAGREDLVDDGTRVPEVVHDDSRSGRDELQGVLPADPAASAGDDGHPSTQSIHRATLEPLGKLPGSRGR
jgi:hypothetical protein